MIHPLLREYLAVAKMARAKLDYGRRHGTMLPEELAGWERVRRGAIDEARALLAGRQMERMEAAE